LGCLALDGAAGCRCDLIVLEADGRELVVWCLVGMGTMGGARLRLSSGCRSEASVQQVAADRVTSDRQLGSARLAVSREVEPGMGGRANLGRVRAGAARARR
jgi:hypothetical protein